MEIWVCFMDLFVCRTMIRLAAKWIWTLTGYTVIMSSLTSRFPPLPYFHVELTCTPCSLPHPPAPSREGGDGIGGRAIAKAGGAEVPRLRGS